MSHPRWNVRLATTVVKVPQMAESITEGTLKQFSKQVGDYVEQDEEIATIETDKIDVAVNAPEAGTITEIMVKEEDTVTVGQDLAKLEAGAAPEGGEKKETAKEEPKEPASKEQETSSQPAQKEEPAPPKEESKPAPPPPKPAPKKESAPKKTEAPKEEPKKEGGFGSREERRACRLSMGARICMANNCTGQDEPHASTNCRATQTGAEHRRVIVHLPGS